MATNLNMRLASETTKALPRKLKFTVKALAAILPPSDAKGRVWVYDSEKRGLAFMVTGNDARGFYLARRIHGKPSRVRLGGREMTIDMARAEVDRLNGQIVGGADPAEERRQHRRAGTLGELWQVYREEHLKTRCSPRTAETDLSRWNTCLAEWAARHVKSIGEPDVRSLHAHIGQKRGHTSANRAIQLLRRMFNFARLTPNPAGKGCVDMFSETSRTRYLSRDEMRRFLRALEDKEINPDIADIIRLSLFTGARRSNCCAARAEEFDLHARTWTIPPSKSKNGKAMVLPLVPAAMLIVKRRMHHENGYVFPSHSAHGHIVEPKSTWKMILEKSGLTDLHFHDLRRSFGSWQAGLGASISIIGKSLGHRHLAATQIYSQLDLSPVRQSAGAAVDAMLRTTKSKPRKTK